MTQTAVAAQVHQALDFHVDFTTQVTLGINLGNLCTQQFNLLVTQIFNFYRRVNPGRCTNLLCSSATNTKDVGQRDNSMLVIRNVYACNTGQSVGLHLTATYAPEPRKGREILTL